MTTSRRPSVLRGPSVERTVCVQGMSVQYAAVKNAESPLCQMVEMEHARNSEHASRARSGIGAAPEPRQTSAL